MIEMAEIDACMMEHEVSPTTVQRMQKLLERHRDRRVLTPPVKRRRRGHLCAGCKSRGLCRASGETQRG